jgi:hypothetical protein
VVSSGDRRVAKTYVQHGGGQWRYAVLPEIDAKNLVGPFQYHRPWPNPYAIPDDPDRGREVARATLGVHQEPGRFPGAADALSDIAHRYEVLVDAQRHGCRHRFFDPLDQR